MKITFRALRDAAHAANVSSLAGTPYGLSVDPSRDGYSVSLGWRKSVSRRHVIAEGTPREVLSVITGITNLIALVKPEVDGWK